MTKTQEKTQEKNSKRYQKTLRVSINQWGFFRFWANNSDRFFGLTPANGTHVIELILSKPAIRRRTSSIQEGSPPLLCSWRPLLLFSTVRRILGGQKSLTTKRLLNVISGTYNLHYKILSLLDSRILTLELSFIFSHLRLVPGPCFCP